MKQLNETAAKAAAAVETLLNVGTATTVALLAALLMSVSSAPDARAQVQTKDRTAADAALAAANFYRYHFARDRGFVRATTVERRRWLTP